MKIKHLIKFSILLLILISFSQCKNEESDILYDRKYIDEIRDAREDIRFYMATNYIPGAAFAIAKDGKIIYSEGVGLASKDLDVLVNRNTKFRVGEISSLFTNLMFYRMQKEGLLNEDSTVNYYYPEFSDDTYKLQLNHLIQQTSGIRNPTGKELEWRGLNITIQKGIESFINDSLVKPPGWYQESNFFNYNLLGGIMERVTKEKYPELLKKYITDTLNLNNTLVDDPFNTIKGRTDFYDRNFIAQVINATTYDLRYRAPSEGLLSNAEDLVKLGNALLFSDYFKEIIDEDFFEPIILLDKFPSSMTNEWLLLFDNQNRTVYGKSGSVTGGSAAILVYPEYNLVLACTANVTSSSSNEDYPLFKMANHFLPEKNPESQNESDSTEN